MNRGYFGIGVINGKTEDNIGTLFRSAMNFGADFIFTINKRYKQQASDTLKTERHIPLWHFESVMSFKEALNNSVIIGVEVIKEAKSIVDFVHPPRAIYLLGAEDKGLPQEAIENCDDIIYIPSHFCLNVAVAGSVVMYDRYLGKSFEKIVKDAKNKEVNDEKQR